MDLGLAGKRAFVTGGSTGIGYAITKGLLEEGAAVGICARTESRLDAAVAELQQYGGPVLSVVADVAVPGAVVRALDDVAARLGGLDIVVACVGGHVGARWLADSSSADWLATWQLNVLHSVDAVRAALPHLRDRQGSVLLISSITGWRPGPSSAYAVAKAALIHLAAVLAQELGPYGIRVNALSPGSTADTEGWEEFRDGSPDAYAKFAGEEFPLGRLVNRQEVADVACLVLSPRGSGVNGANVAVDGGQYRPHAIRFPTEV